ncbi:MAG: biopolymer transporter ExbD [Pontiellaceae bacterium]|nr:biopolymer transporter ExbD [Pontiellaceae bacterium]MBN2784226.1 biopolymer transporter ExbD [Pontiellaceae bacterium]
MARTEELKLKNQIAPLIDIVFLLLIYFMVTAQIVKKEGDIPFQLPVAGEPVMMDWPVEAYIQISDSGAVSIEGLTFDGTDHRLDQLVEHMTSLQLMAQSQQSPFFVTLAPDAKARHGRVIEVMNACRDANVKHLMFAQRNS